MSRRRSLLFASLARMTAAGMPVLKAGKVLEARVRDAGSRQAVLALESGVARGETVAGALRPALTDLEYRMVEAAENGGRLSTGFAHLERYYSLLAESQAKMLRAALYPLALLNVAALTTGVVAKLAGKPVIPVVVTSLLVVWAVIILLYFGVRMLIRMAAKSPAADGFLRALPVASGAWVNLALSRWSAVMHFHLISGQRMSSALEAAGAASGSARLAAASQRLADAAADGRSVAEAMESEPLFPEFFSTGFLTAETTGTLDVETQQQMSARMQEATVCMALLAEWLPRLLYTAALIYGGWQAFQMAMAIGGQYQKALNGDF